MRRAALLAALFCVGVASGAGCGASGRRGAGDGAGGGDALPTLHEADPGSEPHRVEIVQGAHVETLDTGPLTVVVRAPPMPVGRRTNADIELTAHPPYFFLKAAPPRLDLDGADGIDLVATTVRHAKSTPAEGLAKGLASVGFEIPVLLERASASGREVEVRASFILCVESPEPRCDPGTVTLAIPVKAP